MCQPKSKGGKRCLIHSAGSKYVINVARSKTKADDATIRTTLNELNKEGKNNPNPSAVDVENWIETKRFATNFDPELSEHDRLIQLKQLDRTAVEAKAGVSGSHFYAWKNLLKKVKAKVIRPVLGFTLATGIAVGMAGCFSGPANEPNTSPSPSSTSAPASYGSVVGTGEQVTDEYGTYEHVTISESDPALIYNPAVVDQSTRDAGWNDDQISEAQKFAVKFIAEEALDSSALDTGQAGYDQWVLEKGQTYVLPSEQGAVLGTGTGLIISNANDVATPVLIRDGKPRVSNVSIEVQRIDGGSTPQGPYVRVIANVSATYRADDTNLLNYLKSQNPGLSDDQIKANLKPAAYDGSGENKITYTSTRSLGVGYTTPGDASQGWKIGGYMNENPFLDGSDFTN